MYRTKRRFVEGNLEAALSEEPRRVRRASGEPDRLISEIAAWQKQGNASGARIDWKFTTAKARDKLIRAYPDIAKES